MITYIDQNNQEQFEAYKALFRKAEAELGLEEGAIATLQQYFENLGDLVNAEDGTYRKQYTILPLDEEPFKIDANTRIISIPKVFATNGVSVEGDQVAEILYFEIDRYFDAMDLNNQYIVIEWENANGVKGASVEWVKDIESKPGKIIFGWALNDIITAKFGNVKFAVRFYTIDEENQRLRYNFGTQSAQVAIKPTLHYDLINGGIEIVNVDELVLSRIQNSITGILPSPEAPYFTEQLGNYLWINGEDGWEKIALSAEDKLAISVDSYLSVAANGSGNISYNWYFATKDPEAEDFDAAADWIKLDDATDVPFNYEGSVCKVTSVGYYKVIAINSYSANELYQNSTESEYIVKIVGPTTPEVVAAASPIRVLGQGETITLNAEVSNANGDVSYLWQSYSDPTWMAIPGANAAELIASAAGLYRCVVQNSFNSSSKESNSNSVEIYNSPAAPVLLYPGYNAETGEYDIDDWTAGEAMTADAPEDGKSYVYTWYKEEIADANEEFSGIDTITPEEESADTDIDKIVTDAELADFIYNNAGEAKGRNHKSTYTTSSSGYYFCKVEEVLVVDNVEYYGEPAYTRIYKIVALA